MKKLTLLAIADPHAADRPLKTGERGDLAVVWVRKAIRHAIAMGKRPDAVVLLGDVTDADVERACYYWTALTAEAARFGIPLVAVRGNHDNAGCFDKGLRVIGGYGLFAFDDTYDSTGEMTRSVEQLEALKRVAAANPSLPLIALQHSPIYPTIKKGGYPYMPTNAKAIRQAYADCGVVLSLSGHYHKGQAAAKLGATTYHTVPALCRSPYPFSIIELSDKRVKVLPMQLKLPPHGLVDSHCHTELAYCATTVTVEDALDISQELGVGQQYITEHTFQLYFDKSMGMSFAWKKRWELADQAYALPGRLRMEAYKNWIAGVKQLYGNRIKIGLEVDLLDDGRLLLAPEDEDGWDIMLGALHDVTGYERQHTQRQAEKLFLADAERMVQKSIQILAHPFRFFVRKKLEVAPRIYKPLVKMLAQSGVAAEINCHMGVIGIDFFRMCVEHGVKLALGTDSHDLGQVGEMYPHLAILKQIGVKGKDFDKVLFQ